MDLLKVGQLSEGSLVSQRDVDEAVVDESRHGGDGGGLLATTEGAGADEHTSILAPVGLGGAYILSRTSWERVSGTWKSVASPPASRMPLSSASAYNICISKLRGWGNGDSESNIPMS